MEELTRDNENILILYVFFHTTNFNRKKMRDSHLSLRDKSINVPPGVLYQKRYFTDYNDA